MNFSVVQKKRFLIIFIISVAIFSLSLIAVKLRILENLQLQLSNSLYQKKVSPPQVVVIGINNKSLNDNYGLGRFQDWNRKYYAQVITNLQKYQPASIGLDILFRTKSNGIKENTVRELLGEPSRLLNNLKQYAGTGPHPDDESLAKAFDHAANITLAFYAQEKQQFIQKLNSLFFVLEYDAILPLSLFTSIDQLKLGFVKAQYDQNNLIRKIVPVIYDPQEDKYLLSFSLQNIFTSLNFNFDQNLSEASWQKLSLNSVDGKKLNIPLEEGQMFINYVESPPRSEEEGYQASTIKTIPFVDVYRDEYPASFDPSYFKDKIILIGATADTLNDNHPTPIAPELKMPGVMIHANAIQTILDKNFLYNQSFASLAILLFVFALIATTLIFCVRIRYAIPLVLIMGLAHYFSAPFLFQQGLILNLVYPGFTLIIALIVGYTYRYLTEFKQKKLLHYAFTKYVDKDVVDQTINDPTHLNLGGEKREITVIFTDIAGFTTISEQLQPASLVALLNEYFQVMGTIIAKNGGMLDKYEGDAIMAFFGAPNNQEDHAIRACKTALEMRQILPLLLQKWQNDPALPGGEKKPMIDFRVGISTGEAIVGNVGSQEHFQYTAMGDIVNLGSRLESANKKYDTHIMISGETYRKVRDHFEVRLLDYIRVKGKNQPVEIYELLSLKGQLDDAQQKFLECYNRGLQLYFERKFVDAVAVFEEEALKLNPQDLPSTIFAGRCHILKRFPPVADWDFVYTLQEK